MLFMLCSRLGMALEDKVDVGNAATIRFFPSGKAGAELNLLVENAPLSRVLEVISAKSNIAIHFTVLPTESVTANCHGANIKELLSCLLGEQAGIVVRYRQGLTSENQQYMPSEAWLLDIVSVLSRSWHKSADIPTDQSGTAPETSDIESKADAAAIEKLLDQAKHPEQRAQAIAMLANAGGKQDERVRQTIKDAMTDDKPEVRAQAVFALAKREGEVPQADMLQALQDTNSDVRLMAVESIGNDIGLLQVAVQDFDPNVRQLANMKLASLAKAGSQ